MGTPLASLGQLSALSDLPRIDGASLAPDEVHVWYCLIDSVQDDALLVRYEALMTDDERARHQRFFFKRDRHMFLITRALVRTVLSRYVSCEPASWRFAANAFGRPHVVGPQAAPHFNLSNTPGLVACAVARHRRVGVDVENVARRTEPMAIASRFFSASEVAALTALPKHEHRTRFFSLWTLKEAYIKARGMGLAIPLGQFSYALDDGAIRIAFGGEIQDDPDAWQFALLRASDEHFLSIAIAAADARVSAQRCVPLVDEASAS